MLKDRPSGSLAWMTGGLDEEAFLRTMVEEQRLIYESDVRRTYVLY
jgi:hypothetical protein